MFVLVDANTCRIATLFGKSKSSLLYGILTSVKRVDKNIRPKTQLLYTKTGIYKVIAYVSYF